jgi:Leucine-rich repeat (LRR) protein
MSHNQLSALPRELFMLETLTHLDLDNNSLQGHLTEAIGMLTSLSHLSIAENRIESLPSELCAIKSLEELLLDGNKLSFLPPNLGLLTRLRTLSATRNNLLELPSSLGDLRKLRLLNVESNKLKKLPAELSRCEMLEVLDCRKNELLVSPSLPPTDKLSEVVLGMNRLPSFDASSCKQNSNLSVLDLSDNKLSELPEAICHCSRLKTLDISNNNISDLPTMLGHLKYLDRLLLHGNPFKCIRQSVINGGTKALLKHLREKGPSCTDGFSQKMSSYDSLQDGLGSSSDSEWTEAIRESIPSGKMVLTGCGLKGEKMCTLLLAIRNAGDRASAGIHTLCLDQNDLTSIPAALLEQFPSLKVFSHNITKNITKEGEGNICY